jgi:tRNA-binding protein
MKLTVNFGDHSRTILAGIKKERANPREDDVKVRHGQAAQFQY